MRHESARILSVGTAVPSKVLTNHDLAGIMDTNDEWIVSRTGIKQRYVVPETESTTASELGARAGEQALRRAGVEPAEVDMVICATFTPDCFFPSTACKIQHALGCGNAAAFDVSAACAGFVYGLSMADAMIRGGQCTTVLLVGSEVISKTLDWTDRTTSILFGDGAGAVVVRGSGREGTGVLAGYLSSNGGMGDILTLSAWGENRLMQMRGNEVFKHAIRLMSESVNKACDKAGLGTREIDLLIPHQANIRIIKGLADRLGLPMSKVVTNIERYGNTSSASIPLALNDAIADGRVGEGTLCVLTALGGGVTVGGAVVRF